MDFKKMIIQLLGLGAEATDEEIQAATEAFSSVQNRAEDFEAQQQQITALTEQLVEGDLETHKAVIKNRDSVKKMLIANRDDTLAMLKDLKAPEIPGRVFNREEAKSPKGKIEEMNKQADALAARVQNRASELRRTNPTLSLSQSYQQAEAELTPVES